MTAIKILTIIITLLLLIMIIILIIIIIIIITMINLAKGIKVLASKISEYLIKIW